MAESFNLTGRKMGGIKSLVTAPMEELDKTLGTPSAQRILRILVCWRSLSLKEIVVRADFSESQVHFTLTQLDKIQIVKKERRGMYKLVDTPFVKTLIEAYKHFLLQHIGRELYYLSEELDKLPPKKLSLRLDQLIFLWQPLLEQHFAHKLSSLVGHVVDRYEEEHD